MSLFRSPKVGVDIGSSAVRAVEVVGVDKHGYAIIRRAGIQPLPSGVMVGGEVKSLVPVGQAIASALRQAGLPKSGFVLGVGSRLSALSRIQCPDAVGPTERATWLRNGREEISPTVPLADAALSWNVIRTEMSPQGMPIHVLNVAAVLQREVETLISVCRIADCQPKALDLTGAALARAMVRVPANDMTVATIVDVGATRTLIATREGPHLRSIRTLSSGGDALTRALMSSLQVSFDAADDRKRFMSLTTSKRNQAIQAASAYADDDLDQAEAPKTSVEDALGKAADALIEDIAKTIGSDAREARSMTQGIQLVGGGSRIRGFAEKLSARVGVPTTTAAQWAELQFNSKTAEFFDTTGPTPVADPDVLRDLTVAVGLALWRSPS